MFAWWGRALSRLRWLVLVATVGFVAFAGVWGTGVFDSLDDGGSLDDPASESQRIGPRITEELGRQHVDLIVLYSSSELTVADPAFRDAVADATARIKANPAVEMVTSYYETQAPELVSTDQHATYVPIRFVAAAGDEETEEVSDLVDAEGLTTQIGGQEAVDLDVDSRVGEDIARAEMIAMPILLVLLVLIFGSVVAASTPLLIGILAILGAFTVVRVITLFSEVSVFAINIITLLGLGLAVDYALFIVSRFREELDRGRAVPDAVSRTMATAGRTVAVSGVIVTLALSGLLIFPQLLLRSMGFGGAAAVLVAMTTSLTVLPALLAVLGRRIDALRLPWARRRTIPTVTGAVSAAAGRVADGGVWARIANSVMRRPVLYAVGVTALLLVLATPFAKVQFGGVDERVLPPGTESRVVSERLVAEFGASGIDPIRVLVTGVSSDTAQEFADRVTTVAGVRDTVVTAQQGDATLFTVKYDGAENSPQAREIVQGIRALDRPAGAEVLVGGATASVVDQLSGLQDRLPWMALLVAGITFVLMALAFGSVVLPLKAIVMNLISIGAAFGVVVWIFQDGHLSGPLNFTSTGYVEASQPILMLAILFGLSMDYEVFLLSRIREQWDHLGDNTAAVASGVQRTGRIITAAALLLIVVIGAFATSGITFIKMIGVGMLVALVVDATLVRLLLVPATMRLLGRANWWAPRFLGGLHRRYGFLESDEPAPAGSPDSQPAELVGTR
jgi:RND superfamily putative drug exporter